MDDGDEGIRAARQRTWVAGGALLTLSALVGFVARYQLGEFHRVKDVLWALGVLVLVIGFGRAGSITARRPFATIVVLLQVVVASPAASWYVSTWLPDLPPSTNAAEEAWKALFLPYYLLVAVLTVTAAFLIAFVEAVPRPWSWAPFWAVLATTAVWSASPALSGIAWRVVYEFPGVCTLLLGVLTVVLGIRATRRPVENTDVATPGAADQAPPS